MLPSKSETKISPRLTFLVQSGVLVLNNNISTSHGKKAQNFPFTLISKIGKSCIFPKALTFALNGHEQVIGSTHGSLPRAHDPKNTHISSFSYSKLMSYTTMFLHLHTRNLCRHDLVIFPHHIATSYISEDYVTILQWTE